MLWRKLLMENLHKIVLVTGDVLHNIWSYNIVSVAGNNIRISNIVLAIMLVVIGIKYSKYFANLVKNYIQDKVKSDQDAINTLQKLSIYIILCLYVITILEIANVPLSTFAFVGGALAIGMGLGMQQIIGNFISSLVIMVERPVKIGDIIEIEGVIGTVRSIGARCVIVTTILNVDILIPNIKLMQNTLVNWTLCDNNIKYQIQLVVPKNTNQSFDCLHFIKNLTEKFKSLEAKIKISDSEILLAQINFDDFIFVIHFCGSVKKFTNFEDTKNMINLALLDHLQDYNFSIEYSKFVQVL